MIQEKNQMYNNYLIFGLMLISSMVGSLMQTALSTLLPAIMDEFYITAVQAQWLSTVYSLVMGIIIPTSAFLLRRFRTKQLYITSLGLFLCGTICCGFADCFSKMMIGRVLQAISSGLSLSMLQVVVLTIFKKERQGTLMGIYGIAVSVAPACAPALAGFIAEYYGWRMLFQSVAVLYLVIICLAVFVMKNVLENEKISFDSYSFILCGIGFAGITIGVGNIASSSSWYLSILFPVLIGTGFMLLFVRRQLRRESPFLNICVLKNRNCRSATIVSMMLYAMLIAGSTLTPMYQQVVRGLSPSVSGMIMFPGSLVCALISPFAGRWYDRHGIRRLAVYGTSIMLISNIGYCMVDKMTPIPILVLLLILRNVAVGCMMMPMVTWGMASLDKQNTPHGTAILTSLRTIAGGIGAAVFVSIMSAISILSGETVSVYGVRVSHIGMMILAFVQLIYVLVFIANDKK